MQCTKFGQLIVWKIINIIVTKCHILLLKCAEFDSGCAPPRTRWGSLQRSPRPTS